MHGMRRTASFLVAICSLATMLIVVTGEPSPPTPDESDDPQPNGPVPFSPNVRVSHNDSGYANQMEPSMVLDSKGKIYIGWTEQDPLIGGTKIGCTYSVDRGSTWAATSLMGPSLINHVDAWLAISEDDRLFLSNSAYDYNHGIFGLDLRNTTDGVTWDPLNHKNEIMKRPHNERMVVDSAGRIHFFLTEHNVTTGYQDVAYFRTDDGGVSWLNEAYVAETLNYALSGDILVLPNGMLIVSWYSYGTRNMFVDRSSDLGGTWGSDVQVNEVQGTVTMLSPVRMPLPAMALAPNGTLYLVWADSRSGAMAIYFSRSLDYGASWMPEVRISDDIPGVTQWLPDIVVDPFGGIHVVWVDTRDGGFDVYYTNSTDGGSSFGPNIRVTTESTPSTSQLLGEYIDIESDAEGSIYVVWTDGRNQDMDIYFARLDRSHAVTVDTLPTGLTVVVDGSPYTAPHTVNCTNGSSVSVSAPSPQIIGQTRYAFLSWSDSGGQTHDIACVTSCTYIATFSIAYEIAIDTSPPNLDITVDGATLTAPQTFWWGEGSQHDLGVPSPQGGPSTKYVFTSWSDGKAKEHTISVTGPAAFTATFLTKHLLTILSEHGTPACSVADCWFDEGATAGFSVAGIVQESTDTRHIFKGWTGGSTAIENSSTTVMNSPKTITATWNTEYMLTILSDYGNPLGAGWHAAGSVVSVSIEDRVTVNGTEFLFVGWAGDSVETAASISLTMDGPKTLTAIWREAQTDVKVGDAYWLLLVVVVVALLLIMLILWQRRRRKASAPVSVEPPK